MRFRVIPRFWREPTVEERQRFEQSVRADAILTLNFVVLTLGASAIATFGLLENNAAVIIGAMIIAPLILPIGSLSFGAAGGDLVVLKKGLTTLALGGLLSVLLAVLIARIFFLPALGSEVLARAQPNLLDLGVALAAGLITAFARIRPSIAGTIAGTAIAVALMPPALRRRHWNSAWYLEAGPRRFITLCHQPAGYYARLNERLCDEQVYAHSACPARPVVDRSGDGRGVHSARGKYT